MYYELNEKGVMPNTGGYNSLPPNLRELSEKEFAQSCFFSHSALGPAESRQFFNAAAKKLGISELHIFWYSDGTGIAFASDYWKGKVRFFSCAVCEHVYTETNPRMHEHVYTCKKCGHKYRTDSSD